MSSTEFINKIKAGLTDGQKRIFSLTWEHYIETGEAFPIRRLQFRIGDVRIDEALSGINSSLIREENNQGTKCYKLSLFGALLSEPVSQIYSFYIKLLDLIKSDSKLGKEIDEYESDSIYNALDIQSDGEKLAIFRSMTLTYPGTMPFYVSTNNNKAWTIKINDEVLSLYHAPDIQEFLGNILAEEYKRHEQYARSISAAPALIEAPTSLPYTSPWISGLKPNMGDQNKKSHKSWPRVFETPFDLYEVIESLGDGGAGKVFAVKNEAGNRFALKCLAPDRINSDRRKRFKNEMDFCSKNDHRNIVKILDAGLTFINDTSCPFYVMPEFPMTLRGLLAQGIEKHNVLPIFIQILDGVEAAHLKSAFHRDLKPENLLHDPVNNLVVVADFGIAHFEEDSIATLVETKANARMANFKYAAPEQRTPGENVDHRADIFALGLILNEMFTGVVPLGTGYREIQLSAPEYAYLDPLVAQMIHNDPSSRPDSIEIIKRELIARGHSFVALQRVDTLSKEVVPQFSPEQFNPIKIIAADWDEGRLTLKLDHNPAQVWTQLFKQPTTGFSSIMGSEPSAFQFFDDKAYIPAEEDDAQQVVDFAKTYVGMANRAYQAYLAEIAVEKERKFRESLLREQAAAEARARVVGKLRI